MRASELGAQGTRYLKGHIGELLTTVVWARMARTWSTFHPFDANAALIDEQKSRAEMIAGDLAVWASIGFGCIGIVALRRARTPPVWPLLAPCAIATLVSVAAYGTPRFRVIAEPSLAVLAAIGIDAVVRRWLSRRSPNPISDEAGLRPPPQRGPQAMVRPLP